MTEPNLEDFENFVDPASLPDATAAVQLRGIITTTTGQVARRNLSAMSYDFEVTDIHGNTARGSGMVYGPNTQAPPEAPGKGLFGRLRGQ